MRLIETAGFAGPSDIQSPRDPNAVQQCDADGRLGAIVNLTDGRAAVDFSAHEAFRIKAEWI